jgi:hypothetical protein
LGYLSAGQQTSNHVIPNLPDEGGQERDPTMRMQRLGRNQDGHRRFCQDASTDILAKFVQFHSPQVR